MSRLFITVICMVTIGCGQSSKRLESEMTLPFVVKVNKVQVEEVTDEEAVNPPVFDDRAALTEALAKKLNDEGVFTDVVTGEDLGFPVDLELDIMIGGSDFGPGQATWGGGIFSTIVWLFAGHASWFIDNREYADSNVLLNVTIKTPRAPGADERSESLESTKVLFQDDLLLKGMQLSLSERANVEDWFLNILLPPWWGDGDPQIAGEHLGHQVVDFFADKELARIISQLPNRHIDQLACYLVYDPDRNEIIVVSQRVLNKIDIIPDQGDGKSLEPEELALREVRGDDRDAIRLYLSGRQLGIGSSQNDRFYRIALGVRGNEFVRIAADVGDGNVYWTIYHDGEDQTQSVASAD